jgi:hypothetical protein
MRAVTKILAGGAFVAALVSAAPAAAQYYPGYPGGGYGYPGSGYGYPGGGGVVGEVLNQVLGGGYNGYGGYGGGNQQAAINQCVGAVQARLNGNYGSGYNPYSYGGYGGYGNNGGGGRVLGISRVEPRSGGGLTVRGVASSGAYNGYNSGYGYNGYGYNGQGQVDLTFKCKADYRGFITSVDIDRATRTSVYNNSPYAGSPYAGSPYDYSQYGYRRY